MTGSHPSGDLFAPAPAGQPLASVRFAVLDVESTGLESDDRVLEFACLLTQGPVPFDEFQTLVNPERMIPEEVVRIHGINQEAVAKARRFYEIFPRVDGMLRGSVIVAHNAGFDLGFLRNEWKILGKRLAQPPVVDTLQLARNLMVQERYALDALADALSLPHRPSHRALEDARATHDLFWRLLDEAPAPVRTLEDVLALHVPPEVGWEEAAAEGAVREVHKPLQEALLRGTSLSIAYLGRSGESIRVVTPERLERSAGRIYLRARTGGEGTSRPFRMDRILSVFPPGSAGPPAPPGAAGSRP